MEILKTLKYEINIPTILDFVKIYLSEILKIEILSEEESKKEDNEIINYR